MTDIFKLVGKLSFWMRGSRALTLMRSGERWWSLAAEWLRTPFRVSDALTAPMPIVDLLAYQRGISRFGIESERLYRLRVHYAYANWQDAGTIKGMQRIFARLELPDRVFQERVQGYDWDMYAVKITPEQLAAEGDLLALLLQMYGRTCRRPLFKTDPPRLQNYIASFIHAGEQVAVYPRSIHAVDADIPVLVPVTTAQTASETTVIKVRRAA